MNVHHKPSGHLPAAAREKITALADAEQDARALVASTLRRIADAQGAASYNPANPANPALVQEVHRLRDVLATHQERAAHFSQLNMQVREWLAALPAGAELKEVRAPKVTLAKGQTHASAVEQVREEIKATIKAIVAVRRCGLPIDEQKATMRAHVMALAARTKPRIRADHDGVELAFSSGGFTSALDVFAFEAWRDAEGLIARLEREIDAMPRAALELTPDAKAARIRELKAALDTLERREEAVISAAAQENQYIARRGDADPAAILGVSVVESSERKTPVRAQ